MTAPHKKSELPPMMQRYLDYKEQYPDALLFFQVGDFYELFFDDAVVVARTLNLTLTSRDKNAPNPIPMCGVPLSVLDGYIDRLLPMGHSIAVVTQTGSGSGVDRTLERFITPAMRLFTSVSSDSSESVLAAVALEPSPLVYPTFPIASGTPYFSKAGNLAVMVWDLKLLRMGDVELRGLRQLR